MGLHVDIPGLARLTPEIPDGALVVLEGGADLGKSLLLKTLALRSAIEGRQPRLIVSKQQAPDLVVLAQGGTATVASIVASGLEDVQAAGGDVFVDSFSMIGQASTTPALVDALRSLRLACLRQQTVAVVTVDHGMLDDAATAAVRHLADGLVSFLEREDDDGVARYLRIPKWPDGASHARNVHYEVQDRRLIVDTRDRVS